MKKEEESARPYCIKHTSQQPYLLFSLIFADGILTVKESELNKYMNFHCRNANKIQKFDLQLVILDINKYAIN